jgi:hypothetical protein
MDNHKEVKKIISKLSFKELIILLKQCDYTSRTRNKELNKITIKKNYTLLLRLMDFCPYYTHKEEWLSFIYNLIKFLIIDKLIYIKTSNLNKLINE